MDGASCACSSGNLAKGRLASRADNPGRRRADAVQSSGEVPTKAVQEAPCRCNASRSPAGVGQGTRDTTQVPGESNPNAISVDSTEPSTRTTRSAAPSRASRAVSLAEQTAWKPRSEAFPQGSGPTSTRRRGPSSAIPARMAGRPEPTTATRSRRAIRRSNRRIRANGSKRVEAPGSTSGGSWITPLRALQGCSVRWRENHPGPEGRRCASRQSAWESARQAGQMPQEGEGWAKTGRPGTTRSLSSQANTSHEEAAPGTTNPGSPAQTEAAAKERTRPPESGAGRGAEPGCQAPTTSPIDRVRSGIGSRWIQSTPSSIPWNVVPMPPGPGLADTFAPIRPLFGRFGPRFPEMSTQPTRGHTSNNL